jgi:hypothetical protein
VSLISMVSTTGPYGVVLSHKLKLMKRRHSRQLSTVLTLSSIQLPPWAGFFPNPPLLMCSVMYLVRVQELRRLATQNDWQTPHHMLSTADQRSKLAESLRDDLCNQSIDVHQFVVGIASYI